MDRKINAAGDKLLGCYNGQGDCKVVANNSVGQVSDAMAELGRNQIPHRKS